MYCMYYVLYVSNYVCIKVVRRIRHGNQVGASARSGRGFRRAQVGIACGPRDHHWSTAALNVSCLDRESRPGVASTGRSPALQASVLSGRSGAAIDGR